MNHRLSMSVNLRSFGKLVDQNVCSNSISRIQTRTIRLGRHCRFGGIGQVQKKALDGIARTSANRLTLLRGEGKKCALAAGFWIEPRPERTAPSSQEHWLELEISKTKKKITLRIASRGE